MGEAGRMRIKLQPEVFLQECGGGSAKRVEKYNGSERGREELGSKKGERRGDAGRGAGQVDWKGQPIRNLRGERGESEVRTRLSSFLFLAAPPSPPTFFFHPVFSSISRSRPSASLPPLLYPSASSPFFSPATPLVLLLLPPPLPPPPPSNPFFAFQGRSAEAISSSSIADELRWCRSYPLGGRGAERDPFDPCTGTDQVWILTVEINGPP